MMRDQSLDAAGLSVIVGKSAILVPFGVLAISAIYLQKIGLTSGAGSGIGIDVFIMLGTLFWIFLTGRAVIDPTRALLFVTLLASVTFALVGEAFAGREIGSLPAVAIFLVIYSSLVFRVDVSRDIAMRCCNIFQRGMLVIALIIIAQQAVQFSVGNRFWPNLDDILPPSLLVRGFAYLRPYSWNSPFLTPNGVFFLEPSIASEYLAIALTAELLWFRKIWRLTILMTGLVAGMAGTGLAAIALVSPLLLFRLDRRLLKLAMGIGLPLILLAGLNGAFSHLLERSTELSSHNSSGYARLILPFEDTMTLIADPSFLLIGAGPGSSPKGDNQVQWPANKLIYEYGLLTAVIFHVFLLWAVLGSTFSRSLALVVLIPQLFFGGGIVAPTSVMMLVLFGSLIRIAPLRDHRLGGGLPGTFVA
ncbi:hypothetical protein ACELLULO517_18270 [Acidisoma cellulosilytica]|uniref:Uncharacterized protein n=1 Tax=Acidisoma cellulosilyticum TaxID=2802395 RepID=A0A964E5P6_9PROT|nr:hypothetical protein [Acidisoma cellulosilyticum]MCB8882198.1 hypothetical protein [Acidisoma cellulosilyticum]